MSSCFLEFISFLEQGNLHQISAPPLGILVLTLLHFFGGCLGEEQGWDG